MKVTIRLFISVTFIILLLGVAGGNSAAGFEIKQPSRLTVHVVVALCDNKYQGIVPVPARIGNGDDPDNNLYWGAAFGVRYFFSRSTDWKLLEVIKKPQPEILERAIFKNRNRDVYLVADAYQGREIKKCTIDFLKYAAGNNPLQIEIKASSEKLSAGGGANLIAYVGHNGLMDFSLDNYPLQANDKQRDIVILACASRNYFKPPIASAGANPILWTTGLMAPEAYVLKAAIDGWLLKNSKDQIRMKAAEAYSKYQKCGLKGALRLFSNN
ncbi:MAG: hypothetical protein AB1489_17445 [Acidobacteriota bacterium]